MFDKNYVYETAERLFTIDSPSGFTAQAMAEVAKIATEIGYELQYTNKGNGYIFVAGQNTAETVGLSAHIDTLGLMVRSITAEGMLKVTNIGGPLVPTLDGEYCKVYTREGKVYTGTILSEHPAIHVYPEAKTASRDIDHMLVRLDKQVHNKADVEALGIMSGDFVCYDAKLSITEDDFIKSRFIDDKISVVILLSLLRHFKINNMKPNKNLVCLFSTYEEVGHGMAALPMAIDELLSVDMGCIGLDLNCTEYDVSICAKDSSGPYDYAITSKFIALAKRDKLNYAVDIYPYYGSDTSAALSAGNDIRGGLIGPGVHASHGMERTHYKAVDATLQLLAAYLAE
ncbi:M42 family metallopeptidase [Culicoidibacter larvae]|uniref:M42 family metallopeptidase n=1 Tax=Culicoidibacter larvae TaxID=2579976 RepID=A0A5R8QAH6_9FIRM|nr:M42 family metallopeptidase [Culicoidibacter larvae]TLG72924.1 M42 family metallopeptidase [Culicoidibacter larvae]